MGLERRENRHVSDVGEILEIFRIWSSDSFRKKRAVWVWSGCSRKREFMVISRIEYEYSGPQKASAKPRPPSKLFWTYLADPVPISVSLGP
jgi:hypothetical protein